MSTITSFWNSPAVTEYFKDVTLVILLLIGVGFYVVARRKEIIGARPPKVRRRRS